MLGVKLYTHIFKHYLFEDGCAIQRIIWLVQLDIWLLNYSHQKSKAKKLLHFLGIQVSKEMVSLCDISAVNLIGG